MSDIKMEPIPIMDGSLDNTVLQNNAAPFPEVLKKNVTIVTDKGKSLAIEAMGDQIIVLQDKFKTGFECSVCDGESYIDEKCPACNGTGRRGDALCNACAPNYMLASGGYQLGKKICPQCDGKGSTIIAPDIAQRKATSGTIVSCGPEVGVCQNCKGAGCAGCGFCGYNEDRLKNGHRVLYSIFAGTEIDFKQRAIIRIMHEHEIMCRIWGVSNG